MVFNREKIEGKQTNFWDGEAELESMKRDLEMGNRRVCRSIIDSMFFCFSAKHQLRTYYMEGSLDSCEVIQEAMRECSRGSWKRLRSDDNTVDAGNAEAKASETNSAVANEKLTMPWTFKDDYIEGNNDLVHRKYDLKETKEELDTGFDEVSG